LTFYKQVQADLPQAVVTLDGTQAMTSMQAAQTEAANFSKLVTQLGTCLYDDSLPAGTDLTKVEVAFNVPGQPSAVVPHAAACSAANAGTVDGWNIDNGRLRICGASCSNLRNGILASAAAALQMKIPAQDVPVTATILCSGSGPQNDAGPDAAADGAIEATDAGSVASADGGASSGPPDAAVSNDGSLSIADDGGVAVGDASAILVDAGP
jgi:hypothetical protein